MRVRLAPALSLFRFSFISASFPDHPTCWKNVTLQSVYTQVTLRNRPRAIGVPCRSSGKLAERMENETKESKIGLHVEIWRVVRYIVIGRS